jgi:RimJ/RimL family protein N-acetyltransferase
MKHAYRIETERLVIRCYNPTDVFLLKTAVDESFEHLQPWMPWASNEPEDLQVKIDRIRMFRGEFDLNKNYVYGIFDPEEKFLIGGCGLHPRIGFNALEIGYWIHVNHIRKGLGTEIAAALTRVAFEVEKVQRVEIHCDPKNIGSASIPKKLGFTHEATLKNRTLNFKGEHIDSMIWTIFHYEFFKSTLKEKKMKVFDAIGEIFLQ